jgi:hypothetical protein
VIAAWHRKDNRTGAVIVTSRRDVASDVAIALELSLRDADLHLTAAVETGQPIRLRFATYFFGKPE